MLKVESIDLAIKEPSAPRRKAVFSCDRCKSRKRKCVRSMVDSFGQETPTFDIAYSCNECIKSKNICHTSLYQRKQTIHRKQNVSKSGVRKPSAKLLETKIQDLEIKCKALTEFINRISPNTDIDKILSDRKNSSDELSSVDSESVICTILPSSASVTDISEQISDINDINNISDEKVLLDKSDATHYIGPLGSTTLHETIIELMGSPGSSRSLSNDELCTSSPSVSNSLVFSNRLKKYEFDNSLLVYAIPRIEADTYVNNFFVHIHPICNCIDKENFVKMNELFWLLLEHEDLRNINSKLFLSSAQVSTIYLVWILGKIFVTGDHNSLSDSYLEIIHNALSEVVLRPSEDGIQMLILLALFLESTSARESAWILIEVAVSQATSIGMNKDIMSSCKDANKNKKNFSTIWCTIFAYEVRLSNIMGRQSLIDICDVKPPNFAFNDQSHYIPKYWNETSNSNDYQSYFSKYYELNKIFHEFLSYRLSAMKSSDIYSQASIKKAWALRNKFHFWINSLPPHSKEIFQNSPVDIAYYTVNLHLTYHYYVINLGLPFLMLILRILQSDKKIKLKSVDTIIVFGASAINCSKQLYNIVEFEYEHKIFNGSIYNDLYILYHGTLVLAIAIVILTHERKDEVLDMDSLNLKNDISLERLWDIVLKIDQLNKNLRNLTSGSNLEISNTIDILILNIERFVQAKKRTENCIFNAYSKSNEIQNESLDHQATDKSDLVFTDFNVDIDELLRCFDKENGENDTSHLFFDNINNFFFPEDSAALDFV